MRASLLGGLLAVVVAVAAGCGGDGGASGLGAPPAGELVDGSALGDGRVVGVGHERRDGQSQALLVVVDGDGNLEWRAGLPAIGEERSGHFDAVAVPSDGEPPTIYAAGRAMRTSDRRESGVVVAFRDDGETLWESAPWPDGPSEIEALRIVGDDLFVTGFAEVAVADGPSARGMLVARVARDSGAVEWVDVLESQADPLGFTAGVSIDVSERGYVGAAGFASPGNGRAGWLVGMWNAAGERLWESLRTAPGSADLGWEGGDLNVAHEGGFDAQDGFLVIGDVFSGREGSDMSLVRYAPDTGVIGFEVVRGAALASGGASFDEGTALVTRGERAWVGYSVANEDSGPALWEAFAALYDTTTGERLWEVPFGGVSASGETVLDLALDEAGDLHAAGSTSDAGGVGKHFTVARWDGEGEPLWITEVDVPGSDSLDDDEATHLVIEPSGDVWAFGRLDAGDGVEVPAICRVAADGRLLWSYPAGARAR